MERRWIYGIALAVIGLVTILTPYLIFPVCEYFDMHVMIIAEDNPIEVPTRCYWMARGETAVGIALVVTGLLLIPSRRSETQRSLTILGIALGLMIVFLPTTLIGTCANPTMPCNTGTKPALIILGILAIAFSCITLLTLKGEKRTILAKPLQRPVEKG